MIKNIRLLVEAKQNLNDIQDKFEKILDKNYSNLQKKSFTELENSIGNEFDQLLSSCLKFKSARIKIPTKNFSQCSHLVYTQNPGLKMPYSSYASISFQNIIGIENGNIIFHKHNPWIDPESKEDTILKLSVLRFSKRIDKYKLDIFYKTLESFLKLKEKFNMFYPKNQILHSSTSSRYTVDHDKFGILIHDLTFSVYKNSKKKQTLPKDRRCFKSDRMSNYEHKQFYGSDISLEDQTFLVNLYPKIHLELNRIENLKKEFVQEYNRFLERIQKETKSWKTLQQLIK